MFPAGIVLAQPLTDATTHLYVEWELVQLHGLQERAPDASSLDDVRLSVDVILNVNR